MNLARYSFAKYTERYYYEFYSTGPKGEVRKLVCFHLTENNRIKVFNLSFGDAEFDSDIIDDLAVTDNKDTEKVLQTVGMIVMEFLRTRSLIAIEVRGSTPSRNRLYQFWIARFWNEINQYFDVYGCVKKIPVPYESGKIYDAFLFIFKK